MDVTQSLLVAMMFVILLSIGIGNILMATTWQYFTAAHPFFATLAVYMAWLVGVDFVLTGDGLTVVNAWAVVEGILFVVLAASQHLRLHGILTGVFWVLIVSLSVAKATGTVT